jgi:hypothetical protein
MALQDPLNSGGRKVIPVANNEAFTESHGQVSPDSRWVAYDSNESGKAEVYVQPFPPGQGRTGKWLISTDGGLQPRWRGDGKELYYLSNDRRMMVVDVKAASAFEAGTPRSLFSTPPMNTNAVLGQYDVTRDGKRFLLIAPSLSAASIPATVVLNWRTGLKQ